MSRISAATFFLLAAPFAACTFKTVTPIDPAPEVVATEEFEQVENTDVHILLVVDSSGSMAEEQQNLKANVAKFIDVIEATGANAKIATVTTDIDNADNFDGSFFNTPLDVTLNNGTMVLEIPNNSGDNGFNGNDNNNFCNDVINASADTQRGILSPQDAALTNVIANAGLIPDFSGREIGVFQDLDNNKIADNLVEANFADAVSCIVSTGTRGSGQECALGALAQALDETSLAAGGENFGFDPRDNDALLAVVLLGDEDDGVSVAQINNGEFRAQPLSLAGSEIGGLLSASNETNICGSGIDGQLDNLEPVETFANELKRIRPENKIFVATISGPPGATIADCVNNFPVPACDNALSGSASPGNRLFQFAQLFENKFDALDFNICDPQFGDGIADIANEIGSLLNGGCLNNEIDNANFNPDTDIRVIFDLSATGNTDCDSIAAGVATELEPGICQINATSLNIQANAACAGGFEVGFVGFTPPTGANVTIEYLAIPD
jgi:hypothetical protein